MYHYLFNEGWPAGHRLHLMKVMQDPELQLILQQNRAITQERLASLKTDEKNFKRQHRLFSAELQHWNDLINLPTYLLETLKSKTDGEAL